MRIIQLVNGYSKGDGVGNVITAVDNLLRKQGYDTAVYNQSLNYEDIENIDFSEQNIVLYHVALSVDPLVCALRCHKILVFHNITDPELLIGRGLSEMRTACAAGLYDTGKLAPYFESAIVFSEYSKQTLIELGWKNREIYKIAIPVRFDNLSMKPSEEIINKYRDGKTNILFAGRVFPNKKQEDVIRAFAEYKKQYNTDSRLLIIGGFGSNYYHNALCRLCENLGVSEDVVMPGKVPFDEYLAYYRVASVFLCMSAHEGFCIPLVEAMYFSVPILAVNSTAIPDTLGGAGIIVEKRDPGLIAQELNSIISDYELQNALRKKEHDRLSELLPDKLEQEYAVVFDACIKRAQMEKVVSKKISGVLNSQGIDIDQVLCSSKTIVIYGMGAAGERLYRYLKNDHIKITCACDMKRGNTVEDDLMILQPKDAYEKYPNADFIISVQGKNIIRDVIGSMLENGIGIEKIHIYDEIRGCVY